MAELLPRSLPDDHDQVTTLDSVRQGGRSLLPPGRQAGRLARSGQIVRAFGSAILFIKDVPDADAGGRYRQIALTALSPNFEYHPHVAV